MMVSFGGVRIGGLASEVMGHCPFRHPGECRQWRPGFHPKYSKFSESELLNNISDFELI